MLSLPTIKKPVFFNEINSFIANFANLTKWDQFLFLMKSDDISYISW